MEDKMFQDLKELKEKLECFRTKYDCTVETNEVSHTSNNGKKTKSIYRINIKY